jgi:hypothetical protein
MSAGNSARKSPNFSGGEKMADEKKENGYSFWHLVLSNLIGTAAGVIIVHYATNRKHSIDGYVDKAIKFLEDYKKKSQYNYDSD